MTNKKRAFTLIELLVGVLIIAILSAVAVPQYKKAVMRSHLAEQKVIVEALHQSQERYYLANGVYAEDIANLDIDPGGGISGKNRRQFSDKFACTIGSDDWGQTWCGYSKYKIGYGHYNMHSVAKGKRWCSSSISLGQQICAADTNGGKQDGNYYYY